MPNLAAGPVGLADEQDAQEVGEVAEQTSPFVELGVTGLKRAAGYIDEEFLPQLKGRKAVAVYREMSDNDPIIGALLFAITQLIRNVEWQVIPAGPGTEDALAAEFVETCMHDMSHSWGDFIEEALSMLPYGWSWHEIVYKKRVGPWQNTGRTRSKFTDGLLGLRRLPIRAQDTLLRWAFDESGGIAGMIQMGPPDYQVHPLPIQRSLLFRWGAHKNNPEGRALAPDTPVPTPDGWLTMDDLQVGSRVFDEQGMIRHVTARADWTDRPRYRVTFADGTHIDADANHQWVMRDGRILTTDKLTTQSGHNAITRSQPLQYVSQHLLIDPFVLGVWLGDGDTNGARITTHVDDLVEQMSLVEDRGYEVTKFGQNGTDGGLGRYYRIGSGLQGDLRTLGLIGNKHIPHQYLMGSITQRRDLLAGLLDADGHIDSYGRVEFVNTNRTLIDGVAELCRSLGIDARVSVRRHPGVDSRGKTRSKTWAVRFTPTDDQVFGLSRKRAQVKQVMVRGDHYVRDVTPLTDGPTVCIEVDGPSHLFLAGEGMVPSHNSMLRNAYRPWFYKKRMEEYESIGVERDLAGLPMVKVPASYLRARKGSREAQMLDSLRKMVRGIRRNEQEGVIFPQSYDEETKQPNFEFELLGSGGARQFSTDALIQRYATWILMTVLADFIMVGHESTGTYNMHLDKTGMFRTALNGVTHRISDVLNRHMMPRLFARNGWRPARLPVIKPNDVDAPDLTQLVQFLTGTSQLGFNWGPDADLEKWLRDIAGMPPLAPGDEEKRRVEARRAQATQFAQTQVAYLASRSQLAQALAQERLHAEGKPTPDEQQAQAQQQLATQQAQQQAQTAATANQAQQVQTAGQLQQMMTPGGSTQNGNGNGRQR